MTLLFSSLYMHIQGRPSHSACRQLGGETLNVTLLSSINSLDTRIAVSSDTIRPHLPVSAQQPLAERTGLLSSIFKRSIHPVPTVPHFPAPCPAFCAANIFALMTSSTTLRLPCFFPTISSNPFTFSPNSFTFPS